MSSDARPSRWVGRDAAVLAAARACAALLLAFAPCTAIAQGGPNTEVTRRPAASRATLDSIAARAEADAIAPSTREAERDPLRRCAAQLRSRLRTGDFQPGDRIIVITRGDSTQVDTLTVQDDRTVTLHSLPPIALDGVLRSEVQDYLSNQLGQYVKRDVVRAIPLVQVGVLGEVVHPGYYRVPLQISLGDLLMVAGGPSPLADLTRVQVRRGQTTLMNAHAARDAMVRRLPLADLGVDAGDEVVLNPTRQRNWLLITQIAGVAVGLVVTLVSLKVF